MFQDSFSTSSAPFQSDSFSLFSIRQTSFQLTRWLHKTASIIINIQLKSAKTASEIGEWERKFISTNSFPKLNHLLSSLRKLKAKSFASPGRKEEDKMAFKNIVNNKTCCLVWNRMRLISSARRKQKKLFSWKSLLPLFIAIFWSS